MLLAYACLYIVAACKPPSSHISQRSHHSSDMLSCRAGFNEVFPLDALKCFFEDEIEAMMCGTGEKWTVEALTETIKFDHGYTASSTAVAYFLDILTELDAADQRRFLRFVTGSPRLPPGGIAALHPRSVFIVMVDKHCYNTCCCCLHPLHLTATLLTWVQLESTSKDSCMPLLCASSDPWLQNCIIAPTGCNVTCEIAQAES